MEGSQRGANERIREGNVLSEEGGLKVARLAQGQRQSRSISTWRSKRLVDDGAVEVEMAVGSGEAVTV